MTENEGKCNTRRALTRMYCTGNLARLDSATYQLRLYWNPTAKQDEMIGNILALIQEIRRIELNRQRESFDSITQDDETTEDTQHEPIVNKESE